ncbi:hypothetical protein H0H81_000184 [Sphagnurus paluster]|uniref:Mixed lineage kinase domain-containing protein n=1 Tax=Sphagnurus paluster TaxID=117069 RepID=A0A9P7G0A2_9AGAR|nr:hypothetical protein H0H81_000184 [Sphagnurus paluster]
MPLRFIKVRAIPRINTQDVLEFAVTATSLVKELSGMSFFPPALAAVSVVLLILETFQTNKESCLRLVQRCARILCDINDQMEGRWDTSPPSLLKNLERFQSTLNSIHEFFKILTNTTWISRFRKKATIEKAISDYTAQLDDAAQAFQIATLIDIHYAVASQRHVKDILPPYNLVASSSRVEDLTKTQEDPIVIQSPIGIDPPTTSAPQSETKLSEDLEEDYDHIISEDVLESRGFRRYHQSQVRLKARTSTNLRDGWWAGAVSAEVDGQKSLVKPYHGPKEGAMKTWMRDVKLLQDVFHPNLPHMIGFSEDGAPTPFILLSNVETRSPQSLLLNLLKSEGLAACANLVLRFYDDIADATMYIQRQRGLNDSQAQDFVDGASFKVDGSNTVIMGLPPPRDGWQTFRSYGLTESVKMAVMGMLPNQGVIQYKRSNQFDDGDTTGRISHLVSITRGLLPASDAPLILPPRVKALINIPDQDEDEFGYQRPKLDLRQIRLSNIEANTHGHTWNENSCVPSHKFAVGDFGYMPRNGNDFKDFLVLGNVLKEGLASFEVNDHTDGTQWCWADTPIRRSPLEPHALPGNVSW